jgi:hypothetical protein
VLSEQTRAKLGLTAVRRRGMARAIGGGAVLRLSTGYLDSIASGRRSCRNVPLYIRQFYDAANQSMATWELPRCARW